MPDLFIGAVQYICLQGSDQNGNGSNKLEKGNVPLLKNIVIYILECYTSNLYKTIVTVH